MDTIGAIAVAFVAIVQLIRQSRAIAKPSSAEEATIAAFSISETATKRGIDNTVPQIYRANVLQSAQRFEQIKVILFNAGIRERPVLTSCYRNDTVNKLVGGTTNKDHSRGLALDLIGPNPLDVVKILKPYIVSGQLGRVFQAIAESYHNVFHISWHGENDNDARLNIWNEPTLNEYIEV
jgi:hypothetical protein